MANLILMTDSYKASHFKQYPPGTEAMFSYLESRGGKYDKTLFFGLQHLLSQYFTKPVTHNDVDQAKAFFAAHGTPFPEKGWRWIVDKYNGYLPIRIRAVSEGLVVPTHNVLLTVESTDPEAFWVVTWIETVLMRLWYPITVATQSWHIRQAIRASLEKTGGIEGLNFKLHDFGARGVSSHESAEIGGAAHLAAGWQGSDTIEGVLMANEVYRSGPNAMAAFSIPAAEHSTITTWGREWEHAAFDNMIQQFGGQGKIVAVVSDSYDIFEAVDYWISKSEAIKATGTTLVIRPDSGDPASMCLSILDRFRSLDIGGYNSKGFWELPSHFRVIQGDGVNADSIKEILNHLEASDQSTGNLAFGMGGALLQKVDRDTQKFAYKCSAAKVNGEWRDVYKDPITDPGKKSKRGRLELTGSLAEGFQTVQVDSRVAVPAWNSLLHIVYENGRQYNSTTMDKIRQLAANAEKAYEG